MTEVKFYDQMNDELLKFAVIIAKHNNKWVFCKHKERDTYAQIQPKLIEEAKRRGINL